MACKKKEKKSRQAFLALQLRQFVEGGEKKREKKKEKGEKQECFFVEGR